MKTIINTREDLNAATDVERNEFMALLKGSMIRRQNVQVYPEGYNQPDYQGDKLEPIWEDIEDLSLIQRFGFVKSDFE